MLPQAAMNENKVREKHVILKNGNYSAGVGNPAKKQTSKDCDR